jgi:hypothetical protein
MYSPLSTHGQLFYDLYNRPFSLSCISHSLQVYFKGYNIQKKVSILILINKTKYMYSPSSSSGVSFLHVLSVLFYGHIEGCTHHK